MILQRIIARISRPPSSLLGFMESFGSFFFQQFHPQLYCFGSLSPLSRSVFQPQQADHFRERAPGSRRTVTNRLVKILKYLAPKESDISVRRPDTTPQKIPKIKTSKNSEDSLTGWPEQHTKSMMMLFRNGLTSQQATILLTKYVNVVFKACICGAPSGHQG